MYFFLGCAYISTSGIHDATHPCASSLYRGLMQHKILQEPTLNLGREKIRPYVIYDVAYHYFHQYPKNI